MTNETALITISLSTKPTEELKKEIVHRFWRWPKEHIELDDYATYFEYYWKTCHNLRLGDGSRAHGLTAKTHEHLLLLVDHLWEILDTGFDHFSRITRTVLREEIRQRYWHEESNDGINASIDLALPLWLTLHTERHDPNAYNKAVSWDDHTPLASFIASRFKSPVCDEARGRIVLGRDMAAVKLNEISGLSIEWTRNLPDHLLYISSRKTLKVYDLDQILQDHLESNSGALPNKLIEETLLSLHLLFPQDEHDTARYLRKIRSSPFPEVSVIVPEQIYLTDFFYWQDRLAELRLEALSPMTAFNSPWPTLRLLWNDCRNPHQWWTFWFAATILLFTFIFCIVASVATCMQTRYTYQSLQLARASRYNEQA